MLCFTDREIALAYINRWILDGSKLESWGMDGDSEWVVLRGSDGVREEFYIFTTEEAKDAFLNKHCAEA